MPSGLVVAPVTIADHFLSFFPLFLQVQDVTPLVMVKAPGGLPASPAVSSAGHMETPPLNVEDPSGIPSHATKTYTTSELTDVEFRKVWSLGAPLVVTGLGEKFGIRWRPEHFREKQGAQNCSIVECQTDASKRVTVGEFFGYFGKYEGRTDRWKLKDWPSSSDFKAALPELYEEFQKGVPIPNYTRRDGVLNIASHFPSNTVMPDLGTWPGVLDLLLSVDDGGFDKRAEDVCCTGHD